MAHAKQLGTNIPPDAYSLIEDKAIQATKPKNQGGKGLTEQQAMKEYGKELDEASRQYKDLDSIGNWGITGRSTSETLRNLTSLQDKFEKRGDTRNMALKLIADSKLSAPLAYALAEPVRKIPELNKAIKGLPELEKYEGIFESKVPPQVAIPATLEVAEKLLPFVDGQGSPLAIGYELEKKGYDMRTWLDYVNENKSKLKKFTTLQDDQLSKPLPTIYP